MSRTVGVPREIKNLEGRVSLRPDRAFEIVHRGHEVAVEKGTGRDDGLFSDEEYEAAGAPRRRTPRGLRLGRPYSQG